jgi:hypothetical protein
MFSLAAVLLAAFCVESFAYSTYTYTITGSLSSVTINQAQHGFTDHHIVVMQYDSGGGVVDSNNYYTTWDLYNDITIYFNNAPSSGKIELIGQFDSLTTASTDFQVSVGRDGSSRPTVTECASCSHTSPAVRCMPSDCTGQSGLGLEPAVLTWYQGTHPFTLRVYLKDGKIYFGYDYIFAGGFGVGILGCSTSSGTGCAVTYTTGYPTGSIPLGHTYFDGSVFGSPVDDREF